MIASGKNYNWVDYLDFSKKFFLRELVTLFFKMASFGASVAKTSVGRKIIMNLFFEQETSLME